MRRELYASSATAGCTPAPRLFSLRRANRALVLVRKVVADVVAEYHRAMELQEILDLERRCGLPRSGQDLREALAACVGRIRRYVRELDEVGVSLGDFATGAVDFPARVAGRKVCFCWRLGEDQVSYWHGVDEGPAGRRPVTELAVADGPPGQ